MGSPAAPPPAPSGVLIGGRYLLERRVGRGGMAEVHEGLDTRLNRRVAIKLLRPTLATDPAFRTRFRQEAQAAARQSVRNAGRGRSAAHSFSTSTRAARL